MKPEIDTAAIQLCVDIAAADALHISLLSGWYIEIRIHVAGYGTHFQVEAGFCGHRHIDLAADGSDGDRLIFIDLGKYYADIAADGRNNERARDILECDVVTPVEFDLTFHIRDISVASAHAIPGDLQGNAFGYPDLKMRAMRDGQQTAERDAVALLFHSDPDA